MSLLRFVTLFAFSLHFCWVANSVSAQQAPISVLWFNAIPNMSPEIVTSHRESMARFVDQYQGGSVFNVTFTSRRRGGALATALDQARYDIVVVDSASRQRALNTQDRQALQRFYGSGRRAIILDGTLAIRSMNHNSTTTFPGKNSSSADILINQLFAIAENGGGTLIGTDHTGWQHDANEALKALIPRARFSGKTDPSTNGDFIGTILLDLREEVKAIDLLRHWESVPSQGEAPVGDFVDFSGNPLTLYALVETADKPGRGRKRPYISANFYPGERRIPIDSQESGFDRIPTHKSGG